MAIAMLENGCAFTGAFSIGNGKSMDSAEIGVYRNNWYMLRSYCSHFQGAAPEDWQNLGSQAQGGVGDPAAGAVYGQYVWKYNDFCTSDGGVHLSDGMATYWNVPSM
ncbi:MAG: hypothetical protein Q9220_005502 [cf. Caloplaca sp. 1 TL-2023]